MKSIFKASVLILSLSTSVSWANNEKVIYGEDNRVDVYASTNSVYVELAKSTAAMISGSSISDAGDGTVNISGGTLASRGICKDEAFSHQISAANCSGFLVGEDLLVTAGHCITSMSSCQSYKWVFDFKVADGSQKTPVVSKNDVYGCVEIIERVQDESADDDYALIRLDRKVDRAPLKYRTEGRIEAGEEILVIGHPSGMPTKISDGANVRRAGDVFFVANLDTYGGNSGSAVFNAQTGEVEGILVRGHQDYQYNSAKGCRESVRVSDDGGRGEDVTNITNIKALQNI